MSILISGFLFIFGTCVGSFINVLVGRFGEKNRSWCQGRSVCDHCDRQLKWWENIPVFSYIFLGGKCRTCYSPIPWQYPLIELATGTLFLILNFQFPISNFQNILLLAIHYLLLTLLITITLFDLKYMLIPDWTIVSLIFFTFVINFINHQSLIINHNLFSALGASAFLGLLFLITKGKGMGLGDVKFSFFMGLFLGWPKVIIAFYLAFLTGAIIGVILILMGRKKFGQLVPFGPFLVLGTFISWIWGFGLINLFFQWTKITTLSL